MTRVLAFRSSRSGAAVPPPPAVPDQERGVYLARYGIAGRPVLYAVTSTGDRLAEVVVPDPRFEDQITEHLEDLLDLVDEQYDPSWDEEETPIVGAVRGRLE